MQNLRLLNRDVRLFLTTAALLGLAWFGIYAVVFNLYLLRLGYDARFIGQANAAGMLTFAFSALPAGALGRRGVRRMMILGMGLVVVGLALPPLNEFLPSGWRAAWLMVTYPLIFFGTALYTVNANVFLMSSTDATARSTVFSTQIGIWPLAAFAGSFIGGVLPGFFAATLRVPVDSPAPYRYALLVAAVLMSASVPVLTATRETETKETKAQQSAMGAAPYGLIGLLAAVQMLQGAGEAAAGSFFNVYLDDHLRVVTRQIGTVTAIGQLLAAPAALAGPTLIAHWGKRRTFVRTSCAMVICLLPLAFVPNLWAAGLSYLGILALASVWRPAIMMIRMELVSSEWWPVVNGASHMASGLSYSAMAFGGGYIITTLGYSSLFITGAAVSVVGILLFWLFFRGSRGEPVHPT